MGLHPLAGKKVPREELQNIPRLMTAYYSHRPDPGVAAERVVFGTSGHRGSSLRGSFNEAHVLAISQAICDYRQSAHIDGPLYLGMDTHALSEAAFVSALEVFGANGVTVMVQTGGGYTPTPVISHAILTHNRQSLGGRADGVVITPSHNPPGDGGYKYNESHGGPADGAVTSIIEDCANRLLAGNLDSVKRIPLRRALALNTTIEHDYMTAYINDLDSVVDMEAIAGAGLAIGADPLGGSGINYLEPIAERYKLDLELVDKTIDPTFSFMSFDHDGKIRMDCSSPYAMTRLLGLRDRFDVAFANDPDFDRHGIVTRSAGLLNPNHYLSVAIEYLFGHRQGWPSGAMVGKTLVSSSMIDRVATGLGRRLHEVPVGFKWFVQGLLDGECGFGGEESAGASFLRRDGTVWTTDKDGIIMGLLAAEIMATTGRDPGELYADLEHKYGEAVYRRIDAPASREQKAALKNIDPAMVKARTLAGEPIIDRLANAPGNGAPIGGLKVTTKNGWFAARPSGTEEIYKIYAESFGGEDSLNSILTDAQTIVSATFSDAGV